MRNYDDNTQIHTRRMVTECFDEDESEGERAMASRVTRSEYY